MPTVVELQEYSVLLASAVVGVEKPEVLSKQAEGRVDDVGTLPALARADRRSNASKPWAGARRTLRHRFASPPVFVPWPGRPGVVLAGLQAERRPGEPVKLLVERLGRQLACKKLLVCSEPDAERDLYALHARREIPGAEGRLDSGALNHNRTSFAKVHMQALVAFAIPFRHAAAPQLRSLR